jgi:4-amino-4-deoxy-L-arabinose transferase-like glycosyltransferase
MAIVWLIALMAFVVAGLPLATMHGDEAMQIYMSRDYATAFIDRTPERLLIYPPYYIDSDEQLRILNGSVNRYLIGLSWHLAGFTVDDLPPAPGWDWGMSYARNVETDHRPPDALLFASRASSTLLLAASVPLVFALSGYFGGRLAAYIASGLYALNPAVLLNGRRAMQEGSLLFFGLLTVWVAAMIVQRINTKGGRVGIGWWLALGATAGLTLVSKHSGAVFVAAACGWVALAAVLAGARQAQAQLRGLAYAAVVGAALFIGLSPALWSDPAARLNDLRAVRTELLNIQIAIDPAAPTSIPQRVADIVTQPFLAPPMHYETESWAEAAQETPFRDEIARYMNSPLSGWQMSILGILPTLATVAGVVAAARSRERAKNIGLLVWFALTALSLLANPLPWQRYYLPLIPLACILAGVGMVAALAWRARWTQPESTSAPAAS